MLNTLGPRNQPQLLPMAPLRGPPEMLNTNNNPSLVIAPNINYAPTYTNVGAQELQGAQGGGGLVGNSVNPRETPQRFSPVYASPPEPSTSDAGADTSGADDRSDANAASLQEQPERQADATTPAAPDAYALQGYLNPTPHYRQCCHSLSHEGYSSRCHCLIGMALVILPVTTLAALYLIYHGTNV